MKKKILSLLVGLMLFPSVVMAQWSPPGGWDSWIRALTTLGFTPGATSLVLNKDLYIGTNADGHDLTIRSTEGAELCIAIGEGVGWTIGANWALTGGVATHTATSAATLTPTASLGITADHIYKVVFAMTRSAGSLTMTIGGTLGTIRTLTGTYTSYVYAADVTNIIFTPSSDFAGTITSISIKEITKGNLVAEGSGTFSSRMKLESGSAYAPAIVWDDANKLGIFRYGGTTIGFADSGSVRHTFGNPFYWINSDTAELQMGTAADTILSRSSAGVFSMPSLNLTGSLGVTGTRVVKGWFADLEITNLPTVNGSPLSVNFVAIPEDSLADHAYSGVTTTGVAGATITRGQVLYKKYNPSAPSGWKWYPYDADATDKLILPSGMAVADITADATGTILKSGVMCDATWALSPSADTAVTVYSSTTAGGLTLTAPSTAGDVNIVVGLMVGPNTIDFKFGYLWIVR